MVVIAQAQAQSQLSGTVGRADAVPASRNAVQLKAALRLADFAAQTDMLVPTDTASGHGEPVQRLVQRDGAIGGSDQLTEAERAELRSKARARIGFAYTAYVSACQGHRQAMKEAANDSASLANLFVDIALGFMMPGLVRGIGAVAARLPDGAPKAVARIATILKDPAKAGLYLDAVTKAGKAGLGAVASTIFMESEEQAFVSKLETQGQIAFDKVSEDLTSASDESIAATWASFSPELTNRDTYAAEIQGLVGRYQRQVKPIGEERRVGSARWDFTDYKKDLYWVDGQLALVEKIDAGYGAVTYRQRETISAELRQAVLDKHAEVRGGAKIGELVKRADGTLGPKAGPTPPAAKAPVDAGRKEEPKRPRARNSRWD